MKVLHDSLSLHKQFNFDAHKNIDFEQIEVSK